MGRLVPKLVGVASALPKTARLAYPHLGCGSDRYAAAVTRRFGVTLALLDVPLAWQLYWDAGELGD